MGRAAEKLYEESARLAKAAPRTNRFLEVLEEALELPDEERQALALRLRNEAKKAHPSRGAVISWDALRRARGVVQLGGDAVADCERLYDG
jgi:hypothetical protein